MKNAPAVEKEGNITHWKSDKKARLYMCIDSNLLVALEEVSKKGGLSLEDKVEQILHQTVERRRKLFELLSTLTTEQLTFSLGYIRKLSNEGEHPYSAYLLQELGRVAKALGVDPEEIVDDDAV